MTGVVSIVIDGTTREVAAGVTVAAALLDHGVMAFRRDLHDAPRAPLCGMGSCMECRVTIDGRAERRACLVVVVDGMRIETAG
ncbi:MAG: (2Fe-2S)-binding protein [Gemmatimonadales bacterium]|nr:(2Fe-2S)-binding protein [Gemmatimonadales bacterium]